MATIRSAAGVLLRARLVTKLHSWPCSLPQFVEAMLARGGDVVVADALIPFVPSLLPWEYTDREIAAFVADLAEVLAPVGLVLVYLDPLSSA